MTTFTVTWHQQALDELAEIWTASGRRQAVADSVNRIDRVLRVDSAAKGMDFMATVYWSSFRLRLCTR